MKSRGGGITQFLFTISDLQIKEWVGHAKPIPSELAIVPRFLKKFFLKKIAVDLLSPTWSLTDPLDVKPVGGGY